MTTTLKTAEERDWLINCQGDFLGDVLNNKVEKQNLILVTHSRCIKRFQEQLDYEVDAPTYGSAVFISPTGVPSDPVKVFGFLDADDWLQTFGY